MKRLIYHLHHIVGLQQYIVVPESQNSIPGRLEVTGALGVIPDPFLVLAAINLDHKPVFQTDEIRYVWA
jgi:hypothetical protein